MTWTQLWGYIQQILAGLLAQDRLNSRKTHQDGLQEGGASFTHTITVPTFGAPIGQPPPNIEESRDLGLCHPELLRRYLLVKAEFKLTTGRDLFETCTWRSVPKQQKLFAQGRTEPGQIVTKIDGLLVKSRHNVFPSEAIDVCVDTDPGPGKHPAWDAEAYAALGPLCQKHGLVWGGSWIHFKDYPHMELPA